MASKTALNNEKICDLKGQPLERRSAMLFKAIDQLLTVGAYYSDDHGQYRVVSEKSCAQIVGAIRPDKTMAIEITASGMMIRTQLVDPNHRNVRLLHDLLVPLNIAQLEISSDLTPADLRQTIAALQEHRKNLGNTTGFQEIKIENLPLTVSTASRGVVEGGDDLEGDGRKRGILESASEKLAREFMAIVSRILENLEQDESRPGEDGFEPHPDSTPENLRTLREALRRLVDVNPDPDDLARLIQTAKRALDLSKDRNSVDLVFSLLKKEVEAGGDWKYKAREKDKTRPKVDFSLSLEQLKQMVSDLETNGQEPVELGPSSLKNYLGICFHLLGSDPPEALEIVLASNLDLAIAGRKLTREDLDLCCAAVATCAQKGSQASFDTVLPALCDPLRTSKPGYLAKFWVGLWKMLDPDRRAMVWPHMVSDLLQGMGKASPEIVGRLWLAAGELDFETAARQVSRLEKTPGLQKKTKCPSLMALPLHRMYSVHLTLMKSSLAPVHGLFLHEHLLRQPPNALAETLTRALGQYNPVNDGFYLALIQQAGGESITKDLRRSSAILISRSLADLPASRRKEEWVFKAVGWLYKLDSGLALPVLTQVRDQKKLFFFKAWPRDCRELAESIISAAQSDADAKDGR